MRIPAMLLLSPLLVAQLPQDREAITRAALDYVEGWFEGNVARMDRALHPLLAKRQAGVDPMGDLSKGQMLDFTKRGGGKATPKDQWGIKVNLLDVSADMAVVRVDSVSYVDHLQMAKSEGQWRIVHVLWTLRNPAGVPPAVPANPEPATVVKVVNPAPPAAVQVPPATGRLADLAGEYRLSPTLFVVVTVEGDQVYAQPVGKPKDLLTPEGKDTFVIASQGVKLRFERDKTGVVTQFQLQQAGGTWTATKTK